jgi:putative ABC transport system permease protein
VNALRQEISAMDKDLPISRLQTMDMVRGNSIAQPRFRTVLIGMFAVLALVLAVIGIYGVVAYTVTQRTHEIGIRMALGAQARNVLALIIRQGMTSVMMGVAIGLIGALLLSRFLSQLLYEVKPNDPITLLAVAVLLLTAAFLACYFPARRSARLDPVEALRNE